MKDKLIRGKLGVLIVLGVFLLFIAGLFGLFFEMPRFYYSERSLDYQSVKENVAFSTLENESIHELEEPATYRKTTARTAYYTNYVSSSQCDSLNILGRKICVGGTGLNGNGEFPDSGSMALQYYKMIYAHNPGPFTILFRLSEGSSFTIVRNNVVTTYSVIEVVHFDKINRASLKDKKTGRSYTMDALLKNAKKHDLMLITCDGEPLPGNDATQRLAIFADAI